MLGSKSVSPTNKSRSEENAIPLVSVVIPTHNRKEKLERLIKSILSSNYPKERLEIIVVDDASTDGTYDYIKKKFPNVRVVRNEKEKLVSESRNIGIKVSSGEYVFLIDDDNVVDVNTIKELVKFMERNKEVGVAGPIMYFLKDPKRIWCAGVKRSYWTTLTRFIGFSKLDYGLSKTAYESEDLPNAFMVRREALKKAGLFNSKLFPIHYEEADFCQRIKRTGYKVIVVPQAKVWHDIPLTRENKILRGSLRVYYVVRNRIIFHRLYSKNKLQKIISTLFAISIALLYYLPKIVFSDVNNKREFIDNILKGIKDGISYRLSYKLKWTVDNDEE